MTYRVQIKNDQKLKSKNIICHKEDRRTTMNFFFELKKIKKDMNSTKTKHLDKNIVFYPKICVKFFL